MFTFIALVANVIGSAMAVPQFRKLLVTRDVSGVSPVWAAVSAAMNLWWLAYGLANGIWELLPVSAISAALYLSIAVILISVSRCAVVPGLLAGSAVAALPLAALLGGGWAAAGFVLGIGYGLQLAPALIAALRDSELSGIAAGTWWFAATEAALWALFGIGVRDLPLIVAGVGGTLVAAAILVRLHITGHRPLDAIAVGKRRRVTIVKAET